MSPGLKMRWEQNQSQAGLSSKAPLTKGPTMTEVVAEAPVAVQPVVDPAVLEEAVPLAGVKTIDSHEASIGWTAQSGVSIPLELEAVPGTVVTVAELPSKDSLEAAGVDLDQYFASLHAAVAADGVERDAIRGVK